MGLQGLEAERRSLRSRMHGLYARRNGLFKDIGVAKRRGGYDVSALMAEAARLSAELEGLGEELERIQRRLDGPPRTELLPPQRAWVVGLGNPTDEFLSTPHNVGQVVVDFLAKQLGATWAQDGSSLVSHVGWNGMNMLLMKPVTPINSTGAVLLGLARRLQLTPPYCVLVHDDVALPLGTVRTRSRGTDGGHRGVRSVLECFETDGFPRVKIGVSTPSRLQHAAHGVLTPFDASEMRAIEGACSLATARIFEMLRMARASQTTNSIAGTAR
jgi:PTH1 family peptidyl-tRNA hydrolase